MTIMSTEKFKSSLRKISKHASVFRDMVQDMLVTAAFFAFKDGNTTPFNQLIQAVGNGTHIRALTMWIELVSGIGRVQHGQIVLNKKVREMSGVVDEKSFAEYETEMRKVMWYEVAGKQKAESVFDEGAYIKRVCEKLKKEGYPGLAEAVQKAELQYLVAQAASTEAQPQ